MVLIENDKNPGPADTYPNSYLPGYAYENLVDDGVSHPTEPIENTVGYAYMWCVGTTPGHPQPTHVCYYEYNEGDTVTIYWSDGQNILEPINYQLNGATTQLKVKWVNTIEFIPTDMLNEED